MSERMLFVGVSTAGSSIFELFPRWASILGIDAEVAGYDIPLGAKPEAFSDAVAHIAGEPRVRGALVTTHKVDVFRHAGPLFDRLDPNARLCREVSCISKPGGVLVGHAKDPITAGRSLDELLGPDPWAGGGEVLCFGAGGAGTAIVVHLLGAGRSPRRVVVTDTDPDRLETLGSVVDELGASEDVELVRVASAAESEALLGALGPGSLVVNATGLGKDVPGSPISDAAVLPERSLVWELNYRGDLRFLDQARRQSAGRRLRVHDGWRYFLHGWSEVIAEVFRLELTRERFELLRLAAEELRAPPPA